MSTVCTSSRPAATDGPEAAAAARGREVRIVAILAGCLPQSTATGRFWECGKAASARLERQLWAEAAS